MFLYKLVTLLKLSKYTFDDLTTPNIYTTFLNVTSILISYWRQCIKNIYSIYTVRLAHPATNIRLPPGPPTRLASRQALAVKPVLISMALFNSFLLFFVS